MEKILGVGTPIIDHILKVKHPFPYGEKGGMKQVDEDTFKKIVERTGSDDIKIAGGSCCNTIRGLANLGHPCALTGKIGRDEAGGYLTQFLENVGIAFYPLHSHIPTAQVAALIDENGERTFRCLLNAALEMKADDLKSDFFEGMDLVHVEGYLLLCPGVVKRSMELAKDAEALVSFDLSSFEIVNQNKDEILFLLEEYVDIVFANELEITALTGKSSEEGCAVLKDLCQVGVALIGAKGCFVGRGSEVVHCPAFPVNEPLDTTGAGDLFASGFLHGFLKGCSLEECARIGALLGSEVVQILGAELPSHIWDRVKQRI